MIVRKRINDFLMNLDIHDEGISKVLYDHGGREKAFMFLLNQTVNNGMICLDLGGNIGYTTLTMLRNVGEEGFVYAVEPDSRSIEILKKNIIDNGYADRCEVTEYAISDYDGMIDFWESSKPNLSGIKKNSYSVTKKRVKCYSIKTFLEKRNYPNFVKMDVEGHEVKILESGLDYFEENHGSTSILLEVHPQYYNENNNLEKILNEYFNLGFSCRWVVSTPIPQPKLFRKAGYKPLKTFHTDGFHRGLYNNIRNDDLIRFSCQEHYEKGSSKIVRSFLISR